MQHFTELLILTSVFLWCQKHIKLRWKWENIVISLSLGILGDCQEDKVKLSKHPIPIFPNWVDFDSSCFKKFDLTDSEIFSVFSKLRGAQVWHDWSVSSRPVEEFHSHGFQWKLSTAAVSTQLHF
jgi:hypothetical protein